MAFSRSENNPVTSTEVCRTEACKLSCPIQLAAAKATRVPSGSIRYRTNSRLEFSVERIIYKVELSPQRHSERHSEYVVADALGTIPYQEKPMKKIVAAFVGVLLMATVSKAERPPQFRKDAKLVVSGTVKKISSKEEPFGGDGVVTHYTVQLTVDAVDKGDGAKPGDSINVIWFNVTKRPSKIITGAYGHAYDIAANDKAKFWLMDRGLQDPANVWVVIYSKDGVEKPSLPTPAKQGIRENVADMDDNHPTLVSYRKAVAAMKKLPGNNPLSWQFQANMHGAPADDGVNDNWRWCMHGNWWFLPWHRGYIYYLEKIVRQMSGDEDFRLPYWAWESPNQNVLPAPFRQPKFDGQVNPLFDGTRLKVANQGMALRPGQFGSFAVDWKNVRQTSQFPTSLASLSFGGLRVNKTTLPKKPVSMNHGAMESQAHDL